MLQKSHHSSDAPHKHDKALSTQSKMEEDQSLTWGSGCCHWHPSPSSCLHLWKEKPDCDSGCSKSWLHKFSVRSGDRSHLPTGQWQRGRASGCRAWLGEFHPCESTKRCCLDPPAIRARQGPRASCWPREFQTWLFQMRHTKKWSKVKWSKVSCARAEHPSPSSDGVDPILDGLLRVKGLFWKLFKVMLLKTSFFVVVVVV